MVGNAEAAESLLVEKEDLHVRNQLNDVFMGLAATVMLFIVTYLSYRTGWPKWAQGPLSRIYKVKDKGY